MPGNPLWLSHHAILGDGVLELLPGTTETPPMAEIQTPVSSIPPITQTTVLELVVQIALHRDRIAVLYEAQRVLQQDRDTLHTTLTSMVETQHSILQRLRTYEDLYTASVTRQQALDAAHDHLRHRIDELERPWWDRLWRRIRRIR